MRPIDLAADATVAFVLASFAPPPRILLAGFKYLAEHGHPYDRKASELPSAPATC